MFTPSSIRQMG